MTMDASFRALDAFISPSAAMTCGTAEGGIKMEKTAGAKQQSQNFPGSRPE